MGEAKGDVGARPAARGQWRRRLIVAHRWLGLAAAAFWLLQAVTGTLIVFHWEIRDAAISRLDRPLDLTAIERRLDALAPSDSKAAIGSLWTTAGFPDRYEVYYTDASGADRSVRILGDGTVIRGADAPSGGLLDTLVGLHHNLLADEAGDWIVGISGLLLFTNLIAGLIAAWPRRGSWRIALKPVARGNAAARLYSWHRALGLWLVLPGLLVVATGTIIKFPGALAEVTGAQAPTLPPIAPRGAPVGFAAAAGAALAALPGSQLTAVTFPTSDDATYEVRLETPQEMSRAYGASVVLIDAADASVRGRFPIVEASLGTRISSAMVPLHTAQFAGVPGRIILFVLGLWLIGMIATGLLLWARRRKKTS